MRTLSLLRHAKSSWDDERLADFDRPLARRGLEAAPHMGAYMRRLGLRPDLITCSPARRTRQTLELATPEARLKDVPVQLSPDIYEAEPDTLLAHLARVPAQVAHILLIGHNPGLQELVLLLAGESLAPEFASLAQKLPTGALVVIELPIDDWSEIGPGCGRVTHFMSPRDLG